jgi:hypothetical protein
MEQFYAHSQASFHDAPWRRSASVYHYTKYPKVLSLGIKRLNYLANIPRIQPTTYWPANTHSRENVKHRRHQRDRPPSKDSTPRSAGGHITRRRISHVVSANIRELAFRSQKSAVGTDIADV